MHAWAVIALRIIFEHQLPVRAHVVLDPLGWPKDRHVPVRKFSLQRREPFFQWLRFVAEIHKDESFPKAEVHLMQRIIRLVEAGYFVHVRSTEQSAVESVGPRVIRTLNRSTVATVVFD